MADARRAWIAVLLGSTFLLLGSMFGILPQAVAGGPGSVDTSATTVVLVRHAEKLAHAPGGDMGLSAKGVVRSQELARVLGDAGIVAIYASQFPRARLTGQPLARALADSVRAYDANAIAKLATRIRSEHRGQTVLVVGHSDSIPETFEALTGRRWPEGESVSSDKLYVLTLNADGSDRLLRLRYGAGD